MSEQVQRANSYYAAIRNEAHVTGERLANSRTFWHENPAIGINYWVSEVIRSIRGLKEAKLWRFDVPNEATVRRRINYMADPSWLDEEEPRPPDSRPLWEHLPLRIMDKDPQTAHLSLQSAYRMVMPEGESPRDAHSPAQGGSLAPAQGGYLVNGSY